MFLPLHRFSERHTPQRRWFGEQKKRRLKRVTIDEVVQESRCRSGSWSGDRAQLCQILSAQ